MSLHYTKGLKAAGYAAIGIPAVVASLASKAGPATINGTEVTWYYSRQTENALNKVTWLLGQGLTVNSHRVAGTRKVRVSYKRHV